MIQIFIIVMYATRKM